MDPSNTLPCPHIPHGIHVEQIYSMWNLHGIHMESTWNMFHHINHVLTDMDSIWNPHGIHVDLFHMESTWNPPEVHVDSMWIPCGMHLIFQLILKSD